MATGFAVAEAGKVTSYGLITGKFDDIQRLVYDRGKIMDKVDSVKPDLVIMEALSFGSKGSAVHEQAGLSCMIRAELLTDKVPYVQVAPMTLKKFVCGSAGSSKNPIRKEHMLKFIATRFGHDLNDNNIADACGLAYVGMALIGEWTPQIEPQRQVLETLWKSNPGLKKIQPVREVANAEW